MHGSATVYNANPDRAGRKQVVKPEYRIRVSTNFLYLDYNATTPLRPGVWEAMRPALEAFGNPASAHTVGRKARQLLETAREQVAARLGAQPEEVTFTSGATEANNLALFGLIGPTPCQMLASPLEHPCILEPLRILAQRGHTVDWLPVTPRGQVEPAAVLARITDDTRLVCLMLANHETGAIQPVRTIARALPQTVFLHCDAAQAVGKIPVHFPDLGVTTLSVSAHKFGGPKGVGVLLTRAGVKLHPLLFGGHQQGGRRPGTEPVALVLGLAQALELACADREADAEKLQRLRSRFLEQLLAAVPPVVPNSPAPGDPDGLPGTLNLSFPGCRSDLLLMRCDLAGVACSTGSACSSGSLLPSPVLQAMQVPESVLRSAIRFSFGPSLSEIDIDEAAQRIISCVRSLRESSNSR
ncbi:MAG: cysteine desulfurase [Bacteroidales bacterium]|nr:cysteine desulfurase [Bacteroidales bacterium]